MMIINTILSHSSQRSGKQRMLLIATEDGKRIAQVSISVEKAKIPEEMLSAMAALMRKVKLKREMES